MTLTLRIRNVARLDNGMPTEFVLHRRGAVIGRSPTCDWSLPDPRNYISSRHCEVTFAEGQYLLTDLSMNGTILNGEGARMSAPRRVVDGDLFTIGQYEVVASLTGEAAAAIEREAESAAVAAAQSNWGGWESHGAPPPPPPADDGGWGAPVAPASDGWGAPAPAAAPASDGWGPAPTPTPPSPSSGWGSPPSSPASPPTGGGWAPSANITPPAVASTWGAAPPPPPAASGWSSAAPDVAPPPSPDDIWGRIAEDNVVDWARGGFGQPAASPARDPLGLDKPDPLASFAAAPAPVPVAPPTAAPAETTGWGPPPDARTLTVAPQAGSPASPPPAPPPSASPASLEPLLRATGIAANQVSEPAPAVLERIGGLLRRLVSGLVVMAEARARAKSQMGAEATSFSFDGNNPIKFARTPEEALVALLNPPARGFMDGQRAIEDAFLDLQSHQMATLKAMQGALRATLDRFSPSSIEKRAETRGLFQKIMPGARDAALWQAYVREFGGVAQGSDEAFMDVFAKEFRKAYEESAAAGKRR